MLTRQREPPAIKKTLRDWLPVLANLAFLLVAAGAVPVKADKAPLRLSELQKSEVIVVGTIRQFRIAPEPSQFEQAAGNDDWGIYITLAVENVEKGELAEAATEFRCFRIKSRRSITEFMTPSGHRPIPAVGTRVRVYLNGGDSGWAAALPNGITHPDADDDASVWSNGHLADAALIAELPSGYSYLLPLELWGVILLVVVPLATVTGVGLRWWLKRRQAIAANAGVPTANQRVAQPAQE